MSGTFYPPLILVSGEMAGYMIGQTIKDLLKKNNMNVVELARLTGVPAQTLYSAIKRDNLKIDFEVLLKICRALNIPVEIFYKDLGDTPPLPEPEEWEFIRSYRALDDHGREATRAIMRVEEERMREESCDADGGSRIIPLYYTPAAAGYASPAFGEDYEDYSVPLTSKADFASRIQGDSMEPYIHDGEVVLVKREGVSNGDVGLFFVDGDIKCKQYCKDNFGNIYLFSLNRRREDADVSIPASSGVTICCFGKVILSRRPPLP